MLVPFFFFWFSLIPRLALISKGPLHIDCLNLVIQAGQTIQTGQLHFLFGWGYPLTVLLAALFMRTTEIFNIHDPVLAVNAMSAVFGALGVTVFYLFVRKFMNDKAALFGAFLFSFHPLYFGASTYGMSHTPSIFFLILGLFWLLDFQKPRRVLRLLLSGFTLGLAGAARLQDLVLMTPAAAFLCCLPAETPRRDTRTPSRGISLAILFSTMTMVTLLFHAPLYLQHQGQYASQLSRFFKMGLTSNFMGVLSPHLVAALFMIVFSLSPAGALMAGLGLTFLGRERLPKGVFLLLWFLGPLLFYGNLHTTTSRFLTITVVPLIMAEGYLLGALFSFKNRLFKGGALFVLGLVLFVTFREVYPVFMFHHQKAPSRDFAEWVAAVTEPNAVIIATDERSFISHYGGRATRHNPCGIFHVIKEALPGFREWLDKDLKNNVPVYITLNGLRSGDRTHEFRRFMRGHYDLAPVGHHLSEDFHQGATVLRIGQEYLFRVSPKTSPE